MKKTYITPKTKAVKVKHSNMLCSSPNSIKLNDEAVSVEENTYSNKEGYGVAW